MKKLYRFSLRVFYAVAMLILFVRAAQAQVTVTLTLTCTGKPGSYASGSVSSGGVKNADDMITINSSSNRGWAQFDLTFLPAGATVNSANLIYTTFSTTLSGATNNIFPFTGDPATMSGTALYTACGSGTSANASSWAANTTMTKALNASGITFLQNNLGSKINFGFVRGSTNTYNIRGYGAWGTSTQPKLEITYTIPAAVPSSATTLPATNILMTSADVNGGVTVASVNPGSVTTTGIVISTSPSPMIGGPGVIDSTTIPLKNSGTISFHLTGLTLGTTYYFRPYIIDGTGTYYGNDDFFTTPSSAVLATINRNAATNILATGARIGGTIVSDGGGTLTSSGVIYSTTPGQQMGGFGVVDSTTNPVVTSGSYNINIGGLTPATKYYFSAYATNSAGTAYSTEDSFTTLPLNPATVVTLAPISIFSVSASLRGNITNNGNGTISSSGLLLSATPGILAGGPGVVDSTTNPVSAGAFTFIFGGLTPNTQYYYRAYAVNQAGIAYSAEDSFTTASIVNTFPYAQNFDSVGFNGWVRDVGFTPNDWEMGTPAKTLFNAAYSAPNAWVTKLSGSYSNSHQASVYSPVFDLTGFANDPILRFRHKFKTESCCDGALVEISINNGAWTNVNNVLGTGGNFNTANGSTSWYNGNVFSAGSNCWINNSAAYSSQVGGWIRSQVTLTGSAGQNIRLRFRFATDGSVIDEGWMIDDIEVFLPTPPIMGTAHVFNITTSAATAGGVITDDGGAQVTASGVVIDVTPNPAIGTALLDSATNPVVRTGSYSLAVAGLNPGTTYHVRSYATNIVGTSYGPDSTFTTNFSSVAPTVFAVPATNVFGSIATVGGNITSDGGDPVISSGVVFSTMPNPVIGGMGVVDSVTNPAVLFGNYSFNLTGLSPNTWYYFSAYATNGVGTAYSAQDSFMTAPVINWLPYAQNFDTVGVNTGWNTVIVGGSFNNWELGSPTKGTLSGPFSAPNAWVTKLAGSYNDNHNAALVSPQMDFSAFTSNPIIRFKHRFLTESCCDGGVLEISINGGSWTTVDNTVGTGGDFNTPNNSLRWYNGNVFSVGSNCWINNSGAYASQSSGWITSQTVLNGTAGQNNVRVRFRFATDGSVVQEGWEIDDIELIPPTLPTVVTGTVFNITTANATAAGNITDNGNATVTSSGVVIDVNPNPTIGSAMVDSTTNPHVAIGSFTVNVAGFSPSTMYYVRAYATNSVGTAYGADSTFFTSAFIVPPTINTNAVTGLGETTATVGGNIISDGGGAIMGSGVVFATTPGVMIGGMGVVDSMTNPIVTSGNFSFNLSGLTHSTKYYYSSYAINSAGTTYGVEDSFFTDPIISSFPYKQNFDTIGNNGWKTATTNGGTVNNWVVGSPSKPQITAAHSLPNCWVTNLTSNYQDFHNAAVISPRMDLSALTEDPILRFWHNFNLESCCDGGVVEISVNGGTTWTKVDDVLTNGASLFNTAKSIRWYGGGGFGNCFGPTSTTYPTVSNGWVQSWTRLTGVAGQADVRIRFTFEADLSVNSDGWAIDDIELFNLTTPTVQSSFVTINGVGNDSVALSWTKGDGTARIVVARQNATTPVDPADWTNYDANANYGSGSTTGAGNFTVYKGTDSVVTIKSLTMLTDYTFSVYEMNGEFMLSKYLLPAATNTATTLPVIMTSFKGQNVKGDVLLNWTTSSEISNKGFEVERSLDGKTFTNVGFVRGAGNSSVRQQYALTDKYAFTQTASNVLFYRLKQIDFDGKYQYSNVVRVTADERKETAGISVYPNPASDKCNIDIISDEATNATVEITDMRGVTVSVSSFRLDKGTNTHEADMSQLSNGMYFVKVTMGGTTQVIKVTKAN